jgi:hypothetical protein
MLMFNTLLSLLFQTGPLIMLVILCLTSLVVGMLARLTRPIHGLGTAVASGVIAALLILYLAQASVAGTAMALVFGPVGMLVAISFCILGAWVFPKLKQHPVTPIGDLTTSRK